MQQRVVECACGQAMRVPAEALHRMGRCVGCGTRFEVTDANSRLLAAETPLPQAARTGFELSVEEEAVLPKPGAGPDWNCSRCGRPFRGDWDRHPGDSGEVCLLCSRQAASMSPTRADWEAAGGVSPPTVPPEKTSRYSVIEPPPPKPPPTRKEIVTFLAIFCVAMFVVLVLPIEEFVAHFFSTDEAVARERFAPWMLFALLALELLVACVGYTAYLYAALVWCDKLPNESLLPNLIVLGIFSFGLTMIGLLALNFLLWIFTRVIQAWLVIHHFELDFMDIPKLILLYFALAPMLAFTRPLLLGLFAAIFL